jgi:SPP1 gp7 family putative phage head morphogenesis protein
MTKKLLTKKKAKWSEQRDNPTLRGETLRYNASVQAKYVRSLESLVKRMTEETQQKLIKLFEGSCAEQFQEQLKIAQDDNIASQARILTNELNQRFYALFRRRSKVLSENMISGTAKVSRSNLHMSLKKLSGGLTIKTDVFTPALKTIIKASAQENVALIKSIATQYLSNVQKTVMRSITTGNGLKTLIPALEKYAGISKRHAKNMALDQTRKVYNSMNKARMEKIGVKRFEWIHSGGGQKPRQEHIEMSGNIYSFDDLPVIDKKTGERGIPGQAINCRCTMRPVIEFTESKS